MLQRIVSAVDGTAASFDASLFAARLAALGGGRVHLVCAKERFERGVGSKKEREASKEHCERTLIAAKAAIGGQAAIGKAVIQEGDPAEAVLRFAAEEDASLICAGTGRHRWRLGRVSEVILRESKVPVVMLQEGALASPSLDRILVAVDGSPSAARGAALALELAALAEARLVLVAAFPWAEFPEGGLLPDDPQAAALLQSPAGRSLLSCRDAARARGIPVEALCLVPGSPADPILATAREQDADLIVVGKGRHRQNGARRLLGGTAERIVSRAPRPVLVAL